MRAIKLMDATLLQKSFVISALISALFTFLALLTSSSFVEPLGALWMVAGFTNFILGLALIFECECECRWKNVVFIILVFSIAHWWIFLLVWVYFLWSNRGFAP